MDYKRVLRLHFVNHLSGREIAASCGDCSKTTVNEFLKRFRENPELSYCFLQALFPKKGMRTFSWTINPSLSPFIMLL